MVCNGPNISHVIVVSRYMSNHGKKQLETMKWMMRFLRWTIDVILTFGKRWASRGITSYVDLDFTGDLDG